MVSHETSLTLFNLLSAVVVRNCIIKMLNVMFMHVMLM